PIYFSRGRVVQRVDGRSSARLHIHLLHEADGRHYYRSGTVQSPLREMRPDDPSWSRFDIGRVFVPLRGRCEGGFAPVAMMECGRGKALSSSSVLRSGTFCFVARIIAPRRLTKTDGVNKVLLLRADLASQNSPHRERHFPADSAQKSFGYDNSTIRSVRKG